MDLSDGDNRNRRRTAVVVLLAALLVTGTALAGVPAAAERSGSGAACTPSGQGTLSITVLDRTGDPVWGAAVIVYDENWNRVTSASTDAGGEADLGSVPLDQYNVEAYLSREFLGGITVCHDATSTSETLRRDSPYVTQVAITDEGDGDGVHEKGETLTVSPKVHNAEDYALDIKTNIVIEGDGAERYQYDVGSGQDAWYGRDYTPSDGGSYSVTVEVYARYSGWQLTDTKTTTFDVNRDPTASASHPDSPVSIPAGTTLTFTARGSDPDGNLQGVEWYLDDAYETVTSLSGSSDTNSWSHTFDAPGTYTVEGLVFDGQYRYDAQAATWRVDVCAPEIDTAPSTVDMGQFSAENRETVRIDVRNTGCGDLRWDVSATSLFDIVDRGSDYLVVRTGDGVYGDFDTYVEVVALNDVVEGDGFARTRISGTAAVEAEAPTVEYVNPSGVSGFVGTDIDLRGGASPGSDGLPAAQFPAADASDLVFVWQVDGTEIARSRTDGSGGVPAVDTVAHEFVSVGDHTVTLTVEDPVSRKTDTLTQRGYSIQPATVSGTVTHAQLDEPLADVHVSLGGQSTTTATDGRFEFEVAEAGFYTLAIDTPGYEAVSRTVDVDAPSGGTVTADVSLVGEPVDVGFTVQKKGSIEAYDWFGGEPLPDATVTFDGETRGVDDEGRVVFRDVEPGVQTYNVTAPGWGWNNGSRTIYGSEQNLEIATGVAPSGTGVLELRPEKAGEEVAITKFNVYVDDRPMEPNVENNRLVLVEGDHVVELVPTVAGEGLRTVRKSVTIQRDTRTVSEFDVTLREDLVLDEFGYVSGNTSAAKHIEAGRVQIVNTTDHTKSEGLTSMHLQVISFGSPFANGVATGQTRVANRWTAPSEENVRVRVEYRLDGFLEARQASNQHPWPTTFQYAVAGGSVTTRLAVIDLTTDEVVARDLDVEAYGATPANDEEFFTDMGLKVFDALFTLLSPFATKSAGVLSSMFPKAAPVVIAGVASVFEEGVGYLAGYVAESGASAIFDTSGDIFQPVSPDREQVLTGAFEAKKGHEYAVILFTDSEIAAAGVAAGGSGMAEVNVITDVDRFVLERGENVQIPQDTTPPSITATDAPPPAVTRGDVSVTLRLSDDTASADALQYSYRVIRNDESASRWSGWNDVSTTGTATEDFTLDPGVYTIEFRARDPTGNVQYRTAKVPLTVDRSAPVIDIGSGDVTAGGATLYVADINETAEYIEFQYREEGTTAWTDLATLRRTNETRLQRGGTYDVRARAVDAAGNAGPWEELTVTVPGTNVPPTVEASASASELSVGERVTLEATAVDEDDGADSLDLTWTQTDGPTTVSIPEGRSIGVVLPEAGTYSFRVTATDDDGASDSATVTVAAIPTTPGPTGVPTTTAPGPPPSIHPGPTTTAPPPSPTDTPPGPTIGDDGGAEDLMTEAERQAEQLEEEGQELLTEAPGQPGFGPAVAVLGLLIGVLVLRRRSDAP